MSPRAFIPKGCVLDRLRAAGDLPHRRHGRRPTSPSACRPRRSTRPRSSARRGIAELHDFVMNELPQGYDDPGRRARRPALRRPAPAHRHRPGALPRPRRADHGRGDPALDNLTERAVMDAVHNLGHAKTIMLIAHRLTTVQDCDTIFMLEHGRLDRPGQLRRAARHQPQVPRHGGGARRRGSAAGGVEASPCGCCEPALGRRAQ